MNDKLDNVRKRLLWRATHRGIKEMDLIVGGFAQEQLPQMDARALLQFADILEFPDQDLLAWMTKQEPIPENRKSSMLNSMLAHRPRLAR
jgi:antitoxin CptB